MKNTIEMVKAKANSWETEDGWICNFKRDEHEPEAVGWKPEEWAVRTLRIYIYIYIYISIDR